MTAGSIIRYVPREAVRPPFIPSGTLPVANGGVETGPIFSNLFGGALVPAFAATPPRPDSLLAQWLNVELFNAAGPNTSVSEALTKADALLAARLGPQHYRLFRMTGTLMEPSRVWRGVVYRLSYAEPVRVIKRGRQVASLCVTGARGEPEADRLMTILDLIQTDELRLWEMGNFSGLPVLDFTAWLGVSFIMLLSAVILAWPVWQLMRWFFGA